MDVKTQFNEFLKNIRLTVNQVNDLIKGHSTLRDRLWKDENLKPILVDDFLQGSYRRCTAVRPKNGKRADVDIVVVTNLNEDEYTPQEAMDLFKDFLNKYYEEKWQPQGRSLGIELSYVDLDIVLTSAPSEVVRESLRSLHNDVTLEDLYEQIYVHRAAGISEPTWKTSPLRIPDREAKCWDDTDPLSQMRRTWEKNKATNGLYINVVKALKWWRRVNPEPKYPKGYPLEHMIYLACPDSIQSIAEGVTSSLENIVAAYQSAVESNQTPFVPDHGVPQHNVLHRVSASDFKAFHTLVKDGAKLARTALEATTAKESCDKWRELFGQFPEPPGDGGSSKGGYTPPSGPNSQPKTERFG